VKVRCIVFTGFLLLLLTACQARNGEDRSQISPQDPGTSKSTTRNRELLPEGDSRSGVLPVFAIDLKGRTIGRGEEIRGDLKVVQEHDGSLNDLATRKASVESRLSIEIHGESSAGLAKKSYRFELLDDKGEERELRLLGMPAGSDWVLHSCASDRTCLRNVLAYALGREFGRYAPRTRHAELFLNGEYQGLYVVTERIRRDKERVDLPRPAATAAAGDISGGYIFKTDLGEGRPTDPLPRDWVSPVTPTIYSFYYPRFNQITAEQKTYLQNHMRGFETMMRSAGWNHRENGYRRWIDLPSWVDFALIQELAVNPDAYFKSVYLQKWPESMGNRLALGPIRHRGGAH
jgi:hypothetical protein